MKIKKENITWGNECIVHGCDESNLYKDNGHIGYCGKHYQQIYRNGKISERTMFTPNEIVYKGKYIEIVLYKGKKKPSEIARAIVDRKCIDIVKEHKWSLHSNGYAFNSKTGKCLHQLLFSVKTGMDTDHKNRNKLDNRKCNLREATRSQNSMNQAVSGVTFCKAKGKWKAQISLNKKNYHLGYYKNKNNAIIARKKAEKKYFGEFAPKR